MLRTEYLRRMAMIAFKPLVVATIMSMGAATSASAQLPEWARSHPAAFQAQYPNRDVLNEGELTPAGRLGLEFAGGAAPVFAPHSIYNYSGRHAGGRVFRGMRREYFGR